MAKIKKRADGRYYKQVLVGIEDGKKKYRSIYGKTIKEVNEKERAFRTEHDKGIDTDAGAKPFSFWADKHIKRKEIDGVGESQLRNVKNFCSHWHTLDDKPLKKITVSDLQSILDGLAQWHEGQPPLSKRTLQGVRQAAVHVFKLAMMDRAIDYNPAEFVTVPLGASVTKREPLDDDCVAWVTKTEHRAKKAAMIMLYAGLRKGEVMALTWDDIDFEQNRIHVTKSLEYVAGAKRIKEPKSTAGNRDVFIPQILREYLLTVQDGCGQYIHTLKGEIMAESPFRKMWDSYMHQNPPEPFTAHQLRHTYATMLYYAGVDLLTAQNQLGHNDIKTTLAIYTHLDKGKAFDKMENLNIYLDKSKTSQ